MLLPNQWHDPEVQNVTFSPSTVQAVVPSALRKLKHATALATGHAGGTSPHSRVNNGWSLFISSEAALFILAARNKNEVVPGVGIRL
jgi:hypothetical protein